MTRKEKRALRSMGRDYSRVAVWYTRVLLSRLADLDTKPDILRQFCYDAAYFLDLAAYPDAPPQTPDTGAE